MKISEYEIHNGELVRRDPKTGKITEKGGAAKKGLAAFEAELAAERDSPRAKLAALSDEDAAKLLALIGK